LRNRPCLALLSQLAHENGDFRELIARRAA
jgi:hypothetical protein